MTGDSVHRQKISINSLIDSYKPDIVHDDYKVYELKKRIERLTKSERILAILYIETRSYTLISQLIGLSPSTLYKRIKPILSKLRLRD